MSCLMEQLVRLLPEEEQRINEAFRANSSSGQEILDEFFSRKKGKVDIAVMLHGALDYVSVLEPYHLGDNVLLFRPEYTNSRYDGERFLIGKPNPERKLLLFDDDMATGKSLLETWAFFSKKDTGMFLRILSGEYAVFVKNLCSGK